MDCFSIYSAMIPSYSKIIFEAMRGAGFCSRLCIVKISKYQGYSKGGWVLIENQYI